MKPEHFKLPQSHEHLSKDAQAIYEELRAILERKGNRSLRPESAERIERKLLGYSAALELLLGMADLKKQNTSA